MLNYVFVIFVLQIGSVNKMTIPDSLEAKNCRDFGNNVEESDEKYAAKKSRIKSLLQQKDATVLRTSTQKCCRSCGGLIDNETREKLWPFLITGDMGSHEMKENYEPLSGCFSTSSK